MSGQTGARRLLQRQIMPLDRDFDVMALYVDPEEARLDADKYEVGGNRAAKELNNASIRQPISTGASLSSTSTRVSTPRARVTMFLRTITAASSRV